MQKDIVVAMTDSVESTPIALLVQKANNYTSRIYFEMQQSNGTTRVNAKSIMGMMSLMLSKGSEVTIIADGEDEEEALSDLEAFLTLEQA